MIINTYYLDLFFELFESSLSSKSILTAGETSSSYCPLFTDHKNAIRNPIETNRLQMIRIRITLIVRQIYLCKKTFFMTVIRHNNDFYQDLIIMPNLRAFKELAKTVNTTKLEVLIGISMAAITGERVP